MKYKNLPSLKETIKTTGYTLLCGALTIGLANKTEAQYTRLPNTNIEVSAGLTTNIKPRVGIDFNIGKLNTGLTYLYNLNLKDENTLEARLGRNIRTGRSMKPGQRLNMQQLALYGVAGIHLAENKSKPLYGAGINYKISPNIKLYAQATTTPEKNTELSTGLRINLFSTYSDLQKLSYDPQKDFVPRPTQRIQNKRRTNPDTFLPTDQRTNHPRRTNINLLNRLQRIRQDVFLPENTNNKKEPSKQQRPKRKSFIPRR